MYLIWHKVGTAAQWSKTYQRCLLVSTFTVIDVALDDFNSVTVMTVVALFSLVQMSTMGNLTAYFTAFSSMLSFEMWFVLVVGRGREH